MFYTTTLFEFQVRNSLVIHIVIQISYTQHIACGSFLSYYPPLKKSKTVNEIKCCSYDLINKCDMQSISTKIIVCDRKTPDVIGKWTVKILKMLNYAYGNVQLASNTQKQIQIYNLSLHVNEVGLFNDDDSIIHVTYNVNSLSYEKYSFCDSTVLYRIPIVSIDCNLRISNLL